MPELTPQLTAGQVMDISAALLNDANKTTYTYTVQRPYLQLALQKLQELYQLNSMAVVEDSSAVIEVDAGESEITFDTPPLLPHDLVDIKQLWERPRDIDPFIPMTPRRYLPHYLEGTEISQFIFYVWQGQKIKLMPANADNDIKIDYIKQLFTNISDENSQINVINARTFLEFMTAGFISQFIERDDTAAQSLYGQAELAMDVALGIGAKGKQSIFTRRRPFRSSYKRNGMVY